MLNVSILEHVQSLEPICSEDWSYSDRSSLTNVLVELLNKAPRDDREVIVNDVTDIISNQPSNSWPYETEGMAEVRHLLKADGVSDMKVDHFKGCLSL